MLLFYRNSFSWYQIYYLSTVITDMNNFLLENNDKINASISEIMILSVEYCK